MAEYGTWVCGLGTTAISEAALEGAARSFGYTLWFSVVALLRAEEVVFVRRTSSSG